LQISQRPRSLEHARTFVKARHPTTDVLDMNDGRWRGAPLIAVSSLIWF
jgi:hypothetical protein